MATANKPATKAAPKKAATKKKAAPKKAANGNGNVMSLVTYNAEKKYMQLGSNVKKYIEHLPDMTDAQLMNAFGDAVNMENAMFIIRGATAYEIFKRVKDEGRKFSKVAGEGIDAVINEVAKTVGIDGKTLWVDFKIFDNFGEYLTELLETTPEKILPRVFYEQAAKTENADQCTPKEVLDYFEEQRETFNYFTHHARRDSAKINSGMTITQVKAEDVAEREEAVNADKPKAKKAKVEPHTIALPIAATEANDQYLRKILDKYSTVQSWFDKKVREEFGDVEQKAAKK